MNRRLTRALVESSRHAHRQNTAARALAAKKPKRSKAQRKLDRLVAEQLAEMGVEARALVVTAAMEAPGFIEAFAAAREAHGPYEGPKGYEELRATLLSVLVQRGIDTTGVTVRFRWDGERYLRADVVATPESQRAAEDAVRARLQAAVLH